MSFSHPDKLLVAHHSHEVETVLHAAEQAALAGQWVGGFLTYEAAAAFGLPVCSTSPFSSSLPLAWFATFSAPQRVVYPDLSSFSLPPLHPPQPTITPLRHEQDLLSIAKQIAAGESYQVNYTLESTLAEGVDLALLFLQLQMAHRFPRAMWIHGGEWEVASCSPERFLERKGDELLSGPIKGTRPRGGDPKADCSLAVELAAAVKDQAEHVMIVDMVRNDLGKVCHAGSIWVDPLMMRRSFSTVHHLESLVRGRVESGLGLVEIMAALFPAASITGAPKQRTMEIIRDLEKRPRGLYTGCMGLISPGGDFFFSVVIRTVVNDDLKVCRVGLGGGVVADSDPALEWGEIADKGRFLTRLPAEFGLIETFLVDITGGVAQLENHLARMAASSVALGFPWSGQQAASVVREGVAQAVHSGLLPCVGRLLCSQGGVVSLSWRDWHPWPSMGIKVCLAEWQPDPDDILLRHKTTRRWHIEAAFAAAGAQGYDEVLFVSVLGNVTEGAISALMVRLAGRWYVPPVVDGLLPSLWRQEAIKNYGAQFKSMTLSDLCHAEAIVRGNAVRGGAEVVRLDDFRGVVHYKRSSSLEYNS